MKSKDILVLTAETEHGRRAIDEVMAHSYVADVDDVPPAWARALVVDSVPVSFILVDPERRMEQPGGDIPFAFICDVATREDRRRQGHFGHIMEHTFADLGNVPIVVTHGPYQLYRRFGFDVFTHHCGIFIAPEQIERALGVQAPEGPERRLTVREKSIQEDLLLVTDVQATTSAESRAALRAAASLARERGKARILFEHPTAPSYGSRYPIHAALETPFTALARTCGAQICVQGADPESGAIPDADWIKVLDVAAFLKVALRGWDTTQPMPCTGAVCFDTDAGCASVTCAGECVTVSEGIKPGATWIKWPSSALAQLVTGYRSVEALSAIHGVHIPAEVLALLTALFPPRWRLSRNESWTYKS